MKNKVQQFLRLHGCYGSYSGKNKTMWINSPANDANQMDNAFNLVHDAFGYHLDFKISY